MADFYDWTKDERELGAVVNVGPNPYESPYPARIHGKHWVLYRPSQQRFFVRLDRKQVWVRERLIAKHFDNRVHAAEVAWFLMNNEGVIVPLNLMIVDPVPARVTRELANRKLDSKVARPEQDGAFMRWLKQPIW